MGTKETLNLQGVPCPQNSARALLRLEGMLSGETLEIILEDGDPIENVSLTLKGEGYKILSQKKVKALWELCVWKP